MGVGVVDDVALSDVLWNEDAPSERLRDNPFGFERFKLMTGGRIDGGDDVLDNDRGDEGARGDGWSRGDASGLGVPGASLTCWNEPSSVGVMVGRPDAYSSSTCSTTSRGLDWDWCIGMRRLRPGRRAVAAVLSQPRARLNRGECAVGVAVGDRLGGRGVVGEEVADSVNALVDGDGDGRGDAEAKREEERRAPMCGKGTLCGRGRGESGESGESGERGERSRGEAAGGRGGQSIRAG